jgi:predicted nuclease with RNAse H fold
MQKSVAEGANGVRTDKWYRIMVPTEEMYDDYGFSKDGVDNCNDLVEEQNVICGNFVATAKDYSEEVAAPTDEDPDAVATKTRLEATGGDEVRESDRLFFMADDEIDDKDVSMFRFVEQESDAADYTTLFTDVKDNMGMALDMSVTYTRGDALITKASQLSSNASDSAEGKDLGALIDGKNDTFWHSDWHVDVIAPPYLQVALDEPVSGLIQVEITRRNNGFGHIVRMYIQGSTDGETWTNVGYLEAPYDGNPSSVVSCQPVDLGGEYSYLRFINTCRWLNGGGNSTEMDPFAEPKSADEYDKTWTYFHAAEFQIYPVTANNALTANGKALQEAYITANKVLLKDATAEDLAAAAQAYKAFQSEFNGREGKTVLPNGLDKAPATYVLQNKATGLFVMVSGTGNQNNVYLKTIPTLISYKALGYQRSLLGAKTVDGASCNNLHAGESNRRLCTWSSTEATSNSGLVICEADEEYVAPEEFTYYKDVKPGRIIDWCNSVTITPVDAPEEAVAYSAVGWYRDINEGLFLALKAIETIPAGDPALFIYGDTTSYDAEDDYVEPVKFSISGNEKPVLEGATVNGLMGTLVQYTLKSNDIYFNANYVAWPAEGANLAVTPCSAVLKLTSCPEVDPEGEYDFCICITEDEDTADGVKDIPTAIEQISKPGDVYSMDGKLLRTGATLNSLKAMGKGMYILNGVKVVVK